MINFNGDIVLIDTSGQVRTTNGDLTLRADSTNTRDVIVGSGKSLRPDRDFAINLGDTFLRWNNVYATSGVFNTIGAHVSGTFVSAAASIVPNRHAIYTLGTGTQRWANIFATSGNILNIASNDVQTASLLASTAIFDEVTIQSTLNLAIGGGSLAINQLGSIAWDAQGFDVAVINMTQWDWGQASLVNIASVSAANLLASNAVDTNVLSVGPGSATLQEVIINDLLSTENIVPQTDRLYAIGTSALRYSRMHAASGLFNTIGPQTSGTYVNVIGSLVPERDAIYSLGTSSLRWANIYAVSGVFSSRPTVNGSGVLLQGDPGFIANGSIALDITPAHGTDFVLIHGLGSTDWTWSMWRTDVTPIKAIIPKDIRPSGVNAVQIEIDSAISGRLILTAAGASGVATGAVGMFQTTIDFGSTPIQESGFLVTNAFVTPSSIMMAQVAYDTTSSKDLDEMEMDGLDLKVGQVNFGGFTIYARGLDGPVHGEFKINYSLANI